MRSTATCDVALRNANALSVPLWRNARRLAACATALSTLLGSLAARGDPPAPADGLAGTFATATWSASMDGATGAMTYRIPFELPAARGDAQPVLSLGYRSGRGTGEAGESWALELPAIERASLSGWPKYADFGDPASEDRYAYAGSPLTFVCQVGSETVGCPTTDAIGPLPAWATKGYRYYRREIEGSFERFFLDPSRQHWRVQRRGGVTLEFGAPVTRPELTAAATDDDAPGKVFRWNLARQYDLHGARNLVVYSWQTLAGRQYLTDIHYTPPASTWASAGLADFAYHVQLDWESPPYAQFHYGKIDKRRHQMRLRRVAVASKTWSAAGPRELVRAYLLAYFAERTLAGATNEAPLWNRSYLRQVQIVGRCGGLPENAGRIPDPATCAGLPPTTFAYQPATLAVGESMIRSPLSAAGFGKGNLPYPRQAAVLDINADGLPDIVQAWPQNHQGSGIPRYATWYDDACPEPNGDDGKVDIWVSIREEPFSPQGPRPFRPQLYCPYDNTNSGIQSGEEIEDPLVLRSAREHAAWVNRGLAPAMALNLQHHCLDAGDGGSGTLTKYQVTPPPATSPVGSPAALFSQQDAEALGPWGDALLLWNRAEYRGFAIVGGATDLSAFCPQARGPGADLAYPSLKWTETTELGWAKHAKGFSPKEPSLAMVDIDADGYLDRLGSAPGEPTGLFRKAAVMLTRRISHLETVEGVSGPALVPFTLSLEAEESVGPGETLFWWHEPTQETSGGLGPGLGLHHPPPPMPGLTPDGQVVYADVNGDGLVDLVSFDPFVDEGIPHVRPGNGRGHFGCEGQGDLACGTTGLEGNGSWLGSAYRIQVPDAEKPWPLIRHPNTPGLFGSYDPGVYTRVSYFHDVTGDGLADIVGYSPTERNVSLWVNVDGHQFRCANPGNQCVVGTITDPDGPSGLELGLKVALTDFDGNGTEDLVVLGSDAVWHFSFLKMPGTGAAGPRAPRPGLLTRIRNGIGADTEITYWTIQELDRAAKSPDPRSFSAPWTSHVPVVVPVVLHIVTRDTSQVTTGSSLAEPYRVLRRTSFAYRNPAYNLWERSFKGFRRVRTEHADGEYVETRYWFSACESGTVDNACLTGSDSFDKPDASRDKAFVGLPVRVDRYAASSAARPFNWLSTTTFKYEGGPYITSSGPGADRPVQLAQLRFVDTYLYDTKVAVSHTSDGGIRPPYQDQPVPDHPTPGIRVHLAKRYDYQSEGILQEMWEFGRVSDSGSFLDTPVVTRSLPWGATHCQSDWACLPTGIKGYEQAPPLPAETVLRQAVLERNAAGDLVKVRAELSYPSGFLPAADLHRHPKLGTGPPKDAVVGPPPTEWPTLLSIDVDEFGNVVRSRGAETSAQPCTEIAFDAAFKQFPEVVTAHAGSGCTGTALVTRLAFDRGLGALTSRLDPGQALSTLAYDDFGRLRELQLPAPEAGPRKTELALSIDYIIAAPTPYIKVRRRVDVDEFVESVEVWNGLGEHVLGFDEADPAADGAPWVLRDWTERDAEGRIVARLRPWFFQGDPDDVAKTAAPLTPNGTRLHATYDPFGRAITLGDEGLTTAEYRYRPLEVEIRDAEQSKGSGPFAGLFTTLKQDGHGRLASSIARDHDGEVVTTTVSYQGTGEPKKITRSSATSSYEREMLWDTLGHLVANLEPNTSRTIDAKTRRSWTYAYDHEGRLVASTDARGCGRNIYYDALSRIIAEDFSPCEAGHAPYSLPDLQTGDGTEAFYRYDIYEPGQLVPEPGFDDQAAYALGRLVSIRDRGAHTRWSYDARGRVRRTTRRIAKPGVPDPSLPKRYAQNSFTQNASYDLGDRLRSRTTGIVSPELLVDDASAESYTYSARGLAREIGSSYGPLLSVLSYAPSGQPLHARHGDAAATLLDWEYDARDRLKRAHLYRTVSPAVWSSPTSFYSVPPGETTQLDLVDDRFAYDDVSNLTEIADLSTASWPPGATPVTRAMRYDGMYRLTRIDYAPGSDENVPNFLAEADRADRRPVPEVRGLHRVGRQTFRYDSQGNLVSSDDDEHLRYDRSIGPTTVHGRVGADAKPEGPNQLVEAAGMHATYDAAGNMTELTVARDFCWPLMPECSHRFRYEWDEIGQLVRARRWDYPAGAVPALPAGVPARWTLDYAYSGPRVLTTARGTAGAVTHTLDVFDTLRIETPEFRPSTSDYRVRAENETGFVGGIASVTYDATGALPRAAVTRRHVYLHVADPLGSTSVVLDQDSGELVERATYQAYGALEADFRPARWGAHRAPFKFTGKAEDIEMGLAYFGARYYQPHLGRWLSADPLTIHGLGGDLNPYAYVRGRVMTDVDPLGLVEGTYEWTFVSWQAPERDPNVDMGASRAEAQGTWASERQLQRLDRSGAYQAPGAAVGNWFGNPPDGTTTDRTVGAGTPTGPTPELIEGHKYGLAATAAAYAAFFGLRFGGAAIVRASGAVDAAILNLALRVLAPTVRVVGPTTELSVTATGSAAAAGAGGAATAVRGPSIWSLGLQIRGLLIEKLLGGNLPRAFPTIDRFVKGNATSIKSVELGTPTNANPVNLVRLLTTYIDKVAIFNGATRSGVTISSADITARTLIVAIPTAGTPAQQRVMLAMMDYAKALGVSLQFLIIP
ncbi:MAG TPA: toxin TcdB middle/N-terminal domain-containing protein [Thermoanaerobaculia bacterium]|jgi:RHS repeat-associated protein|nr:toxin TcdB middle/N-terminal domain-containing protein [Thermoanaerobaculia bacterium]